MLDRDLEIAAAMLQMSPTMSKVAQFAEKPVWDVNKPEDVRSICATCLTELCRQIDSGNIKAEGTEANAMLHGLLAVALTIALDGPATGEWSVAQ